MQTYHTLIYAGRTLKPFHGYIHLIILGLLTTLSAASVISFMVSKKGLKSNLICNDVSSY